MITNTPRLLAMVIPTLPEFQKGSLHRVESEYGLQFESKFGQQFKSDVACLLASACSLHFRTFVASCRIFSV